MITLLKKRVVRGECLGNILALYYSSHVYWVVLSPVLYRLMQKEKKSFPFELILLKENLSCVYTIKADVILKTL